jgi:hypothetical protein
MAPPPSSFVLRFVDRPVGPCRRGASAADCFCGSSEAEAVASSFSSARLDAAANGSDDDEIRRRHCELLLAANTTAALSSADAVLRDGFPAEEAVAPLAPSEAA